MDHSSFLGWKWGCVCTDRWAGPREQQVAKTPIFEVSFLRWKCQGLFGAVMVETECRHGGRSLVLPGPGGVGQIFPIHLAKGPSGELCCGVTLSVSSIALSVAH